MEDSDVGSSPEATTDPRFPRLGETDFLAAFSPLAYFPREVAPLAMVPITGDEDLPGHLDKFDEKGEKSDLPTDNLMELIGSLQLAELYSAKLNKSMGPGPGLGQESRSATTSKDTDKSSQSEARVGGDRAVYRTDTGRLLGIVGKNYQIVQNRDLWEIVARACAEAMKDDERQLEEITLVESVSGGGSFCTFCFDFKNISERVGGTLLNFHILVVNSFGGQSPVAVFAGATDPNQVHYPLSDGAEMRIKRHTGSIASEELVDFLKKQIVNFTNHMDTVRDWTEKRVNRWEVEKFFESNGISEKLSKSLLSSLDGQSDSGAGGGSSMQSRSIPPNDGLSSKASNDNKKGPTVWDIYSALAHYSSNRGSDFGVRGARLLDNVAETLHRRRRMVLRLIGSEDWSKSIL